MPDLNIADAKGRDAVVAGESVTRPPEVRWLDAEGAQAESRRMPRDPGFAPDRFGAFPGNTSCDFKILARVRPRACHLTGK